MRRTLSFPLLAAVCAAACVPSTGSPFAVPSHSGTVSVVVENELTDDVRVYLLRGDTPILLGSLGSFEHRTFRIHPALLPPLEAVRLRVRPTSGRIYTAEPIMASRGDEIVWHLGPRLGMSYLSLRQRN